ncbi:hypothetical protein A8B78_06660 [Jannaschia sp. EhC01]|nr:hypothetical protein A8B78_06660 [Jannaschia sp. EhC01]
MTYSFKATAGAAAFFLGLLSAPVQATSVNWGDEGGLNAFATATINFTGFEADTLVNITSQGYYATNNGLLYPVDFELEVLLDGLWTSIFSDTTTGTSYIDNIPTLTFAYGTITGLRATGTGHAPSTTPMGNWALGPNFTPTVFHFDALNPPAAVPVPAGLPLLLGALGALGIAVRQRRRA